MKIMIDLFPNHQFEPKMVTGWWFQPIWKNIPQKWVHLPQVSGWTHKNIWKPPKTNQVIYRGCKIHQFKGISIISLQFLHVTKVWSKLRPRPIPELQNFPPKMGVFSGCVVIVSSNRFGSHRGKIVHFPWLRLRLVFKKSQTNIGSTNHNLTKTLRVWIIMIVTQRTWT